MRKSSKCHNILSLEVEHPNIFPNSGVSIRKRICLVLRYDKRGVGPNFTISDSNAWRNLTFNNLKQDAETALSVRLEQPEVNSTKKATLIGHSEGTNIPQRVAVDNPDKVRNIVLMSPVAEKWRDIIYSQEVAYPLRYAESVLDKDYTGQLSVEEASGDPIFQKLVEESEGGNLTIPYFSNISGVRCFNISVCVF